METKCKDSDLKEFCSNTTLHGARYLTDKSLVRRVIWLVALCVAVGFCTRDVYSTLNAFFDKPFSTSLTRHRVSEMTFPAVTVCNLNSINVKRFTDKELERKIHADYINGSSKREAMVRNNLNRRIKLIVNVLSSHGKENDEIKTLQKALSTWEELKEMGSFREAFIKGAHSIEGMLSLNFLKPCTWRGKECSSNNFTSFLDMLMGKCFTFNSGRKGHGTLKTSLPGPFNGLRLKLNVEDFGHVLNYYSLAAGFKVLIHDQDEYPSVEDSGFALQPGTHTFAAVRQKKYKNLPKPYKTKCDSPDIPFAKYLNYSYSVHACIKQCMLEYIVETCHCQPLFNITPGINFCSIVNISKCVFPKTFGVTPDKVAKCFNQCPEPCEYIKYETKLSYATAVGNSFSREIIFDQLKIDDPSKALRNFLNKTEKERQHFIRNNVASLDVYFEELGYDFIEQKPAFDDWALLGAVGGTLGLFLGTSVLTVLEFIDFFFVWLMRGLRRDKTRKNSSLSKQEIGEINHGKVLDTKIS